MLHSSLPIISWRAVPGVTNCPLDEPYRHRRRGRIVVLEPSGELYCKFRQRFRRVAGHDPSITLVFENAPHRSTAEPRLTARIDQFFSHSTAHSIFGADQPIRRTAVENVFFESDAALDARNA
jgi:hypothetical protein